MTTARQARRQAAKDDSVLAAGGKVPAGGGAGGAPAKVRRRTQRGAKARHLRSRVPGRPRGADKEPESFAVRCKGCGKLSPAYQIDDCPAEWNCPCGLKCDVADLVKRYHAAKAEAQRRAH